jgi:hypothetical protein
MGEYTLWHSAHLRSVHPSAPCEGVFAALGTTDKVPDSRSMMGA